MTTQLSPTPVQKFFDNNGNPLFNGQLFTYAAGTSTPQATYTDSTGATQNTNPVILNARGEANIWLNPSLAYKYVLEDSVGNQIWAIDNILGSSGINASVSNVTALRAYSGTLTGQIVFLQGYTTQNDGGQGPFQWGAYATDNGGTIITPTGQVAGSWYRIFSIILSKPWFDTTADFNSVLTNSGLIGLYSAPSATNPTMILTTPAEYTFFQLFQHYESAAAPFGIAQGYMTNVDYARNDQYYCIGYNPEIQGRYSFNPSEPTWAFNFESFYEQSGFNKSVRMEWYLFFDPVLFVDPTVTITAGGTGYTSAPTVIFSAPHVTGGVTATGTATVAAGAVTGVTVTNGGSGYSIVPTITFGGPGTGAAATCTVSSQNAENIRPIAAYTTRQAAAGYPVGYTRVELIANGLFLSAPPMGDGTPEVELLSVSSGSPPSLNFFNSLLIEGETNNVFMMRQINAAGTGYINILKVDGSNNIQLGDNITLPNVNIPAVLNSFAASLQLQTGNVTIIEIDSSAGQKLAFYGGTVAAKPSITGALSTVTDANAKAVLTSIIAALDSSGVNLVTNSTT